MLATTVREEWNDFEEKCLHEKSNEVVQNYRHVFYAAYNAALLQVMTLLRTGADVDDVIALEKECHEYWRSLHMVDSEGGETD
jgi:hypothetical protein